MRPVIALFCASIAAADATGAMCRSMGHPQKDFVPPNFTIDEVPVMFQGIRASTLLMRRPVIQNAPATTAPNFKIGHYNIGWFSADMHFATHFICYAALIALKEGRLAEIVPNWKDFSVELVEVVKHHNFLYYDDNVAAFELLRGDLLEKLDLQPEPNASQKTAIIGGMGRGAALAFARVSNQCKVPLIMHAPGEAFSDKSLHPFVLRNMGKTTYAITGMASAVGYFGWDRIMVITYPDTEVHAKTIETSYRQVVPFGELIQERVAVPFDYSDTDPLCPSQSVCQLVQHEVKLQAWAESVAEMEPRILLTWYDRSHALPGLLVFFDAVGLVGAGYMWFLGGMVASPQSVFPRSLGGNLVLKSLRQAYPNSTLSAYPFDDLVALQVGFLRVTTEVDGPCVSPIRSFWRNLTVNKLLAVGARWTAKPFDPAAASVRERSEGERFLTLSENTFIYNALMFDSTVAVLVAIGELLAKGVAPTEIRGRKLLDAMRATDFDGVSGHVRFDENGDRIAGFHLEQVFRKTHKVFLKMPVSFVPVASIDVQGRSINRSGFPALHFAGGSSTPPSAWRAPCSSGSDYQGRKAGCVVCQAGRYNDEPDGPHSRSPCHSCKSGHTAEANSTVCRACIRGRAPDASSAFCAACTPGRFANVDASAKCIACNQGTYSGTGAQECKLCHKGQFADMHSSSRCTACQAGLTTIHVGSKTPASCVCPAGSYMPKAAGATCRTCPVKGFACPEGSAEANIPTSAEGNSTLEADASTYPWVLPKFYTEKKDPMSVYECVDVKACPGHLPESCASGRTGIACGTCLDGYSANTNLECVECEVADPHAWIYVLFATICGLAIYIALVAFRSRKKDVADWKGLKVKIVCLLGATLTYVQLFATSKSLDVAQPSGSTSFVTFSSFSVDPVKSVNPHCMGVVSYTANYVAKFMAPVGLAIASSLALGLVKVSGRFVQRCAVVTWGSICDKFGSIFFMFYISIASMALSHFMCYPHPNGKHSVRSAPEVLCYTEEWFGLTALAVLGICLFIVLPIVIVLHVIRTAPRHYGKKPYRSATKFLFFKYRVGGVRWALVSLLKSLGITLASIIFTKAFQQVVWLCLVLVIYAVAAASFLPFRTLDICIYDTFLHLAMIFVYKLNGALASPDEQSPDDIGKTIVAFTVGSLVFAVVIVCLFQAMLLWMIPTRSMRDVQQLCQHLKFAGNQEGTMSELVKVLPPNELWALDQVERLVARERGGQQGIFVAGLAGMLATQSNVQAEVVGAGEHMDDDAEVTI